MSMIVYAMMKHGNSPPGAIVNLGIPDCMRLPGIEFDTKWWHACQYSSVALHRCETSATNKPTLDLLVASF
jgi:hypothetical protein